MVRAQYKIPSEHGVILPTVLVLTAILMGIGFTVLGAVTGQYTLARDSIFTANALQTAEAGVEQSIEQLNQNDAFAGYPSNTTLYNSATQGYGNFITTIANSPDDSNAKIITSTGYAYHYGQTANPVSTRKVKVTVVGTSTSGFSVLTGPGGLQLLGGTTISNGTVYSNGPITLGGGAQIGSNNTPLDVFSANEQCPTGSNPGSTYPQVCSNGLQPITVPNGAHIYGNVCATGQTTSTNILPGSGGAGLKPGCIAPVQPMVTYDRTGQIAAVATTVANSNHIANGCSTWTNPDAFSRTWPANLKITGNVHITSSCAITLTGNVYITGNLVVDGGSSLIVANSLGTNRPKILVDGTIEVTGGPTLVTNSNGTAPDFYSFYSTASCGASCSTLSGNDLKTSSSAISVYLHGGARMPGASFYAYWAEAKVSEGSSAGAVAGQTVDLDGAGTITFGTIIGSGTKTWTISSYQIIPNGT